MLGLETDRVIEPVALSSREPAPPLPQGTITAEPVPDAVRSQPVPLVRMLMPIVMIAAMVGLVALILVTGAKDGRQLSPMMLLFPVMMLMSVAMMFSPQGGGANDPDETRRTYLRHLKALREKAVDNGRKQRAHEVHRHPAPGDLHAHIGSPRMWERAANDPDALEVRIGVGVTKLCTPISVPDTGASEDLDPVCAVSLRHTLQAVETLADMPVVIQLQAFRFLGLSGPRARELARAMVIQLAIAHGPEVLGLSAQCHGGQWDWLKWLPHARCPQDAHFRVLIVDSLPTTGVEDFLTGDDYTTIIEVGSQRTTFLGQRAEQEGLCLLADAELRVITAAGDEKLGTPDGMSEDAARLVARRAASFHRPAGTTAAAGTFSGELLPMLGVSDVEELTGDTGGMWPGRKGASRLCVPIGVTPQGQAVTLDLKESAEGGMGPHGLCIGATGSGKSELLRTLVTALAATHSPDELNLVLVDFKGGATFLGCDSLPHTSAVITNLEDEATLVERMYDAISGEMHRRQELLRRAGNFANVGDYTVARADGQFAAAGVDDPGPLPALVIIVDEFSELLGQHPDFAELFVAVGRLGRSLHVHLLLASQRLEEGRLRGLDSHLSYRLGLRTFSAAESRQVLGATDAYHLSNQPGAGYLKTDAEELTRFQASYVSGPLPRQVAAPTDFAHASSARIELFTGWEKEEDTAPTVVYDDSTTVMAEVVKAATAEAAVRGESAHRIWLPPLPAAIRLPDVVRLYSRSGGGKKLEGNALRCPVGILDRPYRQRQDPLVVDFTQNGGHLALCGGPQAGKSMALRTIAAALAEGHTPAQVRFYVLDLGGGALAGLDRLPHTSGVADRTDGERVRRVVDEVLGLITEPDERETFLLVDGWHHVGTAGADFEDLAEKITAIAADGPAARVHLVVTTPRWTTMRPSIRDLIGTRLELRLGEAMDSLIDRKKQQKLPAAPGRGITGDGENFLFALTATEDLAHLATTPENIACPPVPALKMLPADLPVTELEAHCAGTPSATSIPWGIGGPRLEPVAWDPAAEPHVVCVGSSGCGKSSFLATLVRGISRLPREDARLVVVDHRRSHLGAIEETMLAAYSASSAATEKALRDTAATLTARLPGPDVTAAQLARRDWWEGPDIYVVIDDFDLVTDMALHPLVELIPHARDIGLHLVVARKAGGINRALFGKFFAGLRDTQPSVFLMDADKDEGPIFGTKPTHQPAGRGTWTVRGNPVGLCQSARPRQASVSVVAGEVRA